MAEPLDRSLTIPGLARRWRCRTEFVRALLKAGTLRAIEIKGRKRILPESVQAAEQGTLATTPRRHKRAERVDPEVLSILSD